MIHVVDSIMGSGKTNWAIQYMNENPDKKFVYITPYTEEIDERMLKVCKGFQQPEHAIVNGKKERKLTDLHRLLREGSNICSTHALFKLTTDETIRLLQEHNYILIMDEVFDVIEQLSLKRDDLKDIFERKHAHVDELTGYLVWDNLSYNGRYNDVMKLALNKNVFVIDNTALVWLFPAQIFKYFSDTYILTYMFNCQVQRYYFDLNKVNYQYFKVHLDDNGYFIKEHDFMPDDTSKFKINIHTGKMNDVGKGFNSLCVEWYKKNRKRLPELQKHLYNFFRNICKSTSEVNLWTTFDEYKKHLQGKGYTEGFLACNARAVNKYRDRVNVAYTVNRFMNVAVYKFFTKVHKMKIGKEEQRMYGLAEMLQFIYRSGLRNGKSINLYVPSERMRHSLQEWLGIPKAD